MTYEYINGKAVGRDIIKENAEARAEAAKLKEAPKAEVKTEAKEEPKAEVKAEAKK